MRTRGRKHDILINVYKKLYNFYGPQGWWPGRSRLEVIVGAILTQNTAWRNVELAIKNLRKADLLSSPSKIKAYSDKKLARLIKPAGYYNVKARRLKNCMDFISREYGSSLARVSRSETEKLKEGLLGVNGIGPETCDSILLYAFQRPVFVVDAYTRRVLERHRLCGRDADYYKIQKFFMEALPKDDRLYNEYHALLVRLGKDFCKTRPCCSGCPLETDKKPCN